MSSWVIVVVAAWIPLALMERQHQLRQKSKVGVARDASRLDTFEYGTEMTEYMRAAFPVIYRYVLTTEAISAQHAQVVDMARPADGEDWEEYVQLSRLLSLLDVMSVGVTQDVLDFEVFQRLGGPRMNIICERMSHLIDLREQQQPGRYEALLEVDRLFRAIDTERSAQAGRQQRSLVGKTVLLSDKKASTGT